jgi:hypothetical protein
VGGGWGLNTRQLKAGKQHHKLPAGASCAGWNLTRLDSESVSVEGIGGGGDRADAYPCTKANSSSEVTLASNQ